MSALLPTIEIWLSNPLNEFGNVSFAGHNESYLFGDLDRISSKDNVWVDPSLNALSLRPIYIPQDNARSRFSTMAIAGTPMWDEYMRPETQQLVTRQYIATTGVEWMATTATVYTGDIFVDLFQVSAAMDATRQEGNILRKVFWPAPYVAGTPSYSLVFDWGVGISLHKTLDGGVSWSQVDSLDGAVMPRFGEWTRIMMMNRLGQVVVSIGDTGQFLHDRSSGNIGTGKVMIYGKNGACAFAVHPVYYPKSGTWIGPWLQKPDPNAPHAYALTRGTIPAKCSATSMVSYSGKYFQPWTVLTTGTVATPSGYGTTTPVFNSIYINWPCVTRPGGFTYRTKLPKIWAVRENLSVDLRNLNIFANYSITCGNRRGEFTWASGVRAAELLLGYNGANTRRFVGLLGHNVDYTISRGESVAEISLWDRSAQLRPPVGKMIERVPDVDGWCIYKAMAWLAMEGGIEPRWHGFPNCRGDIFNPCPHYKLPIGDGFKRLVELTVGQYVWDAMNQVRKYAGPLPHILYFDKNSVLHFEPFNPTAIGYPKKVFREVPDPALPNEIMSLSYSRDLTQVRNAVSIIGIDPNTWQPISAKNIDQSSIRNINAANFLGSEANFVWADTMFATTEYAQQAADVLFAQFRRPEETVIFQTWGQDGQGIYPLDIIGIHESRAIGGYGLFRVIGIQSEWSRGTHNLAKSQISAVRIY